MAQNKRLTKDALRKTIAKRLKETREKMVPRLTQEDLAQMFNPPITRAAIAQWESGETLPDIDRLAVLSKAYGVTIDALVFDATEEEHGLTAEAVRLARTWMQLAKKHRAIAANLIFSFK